MSSVGLAHVVYFTLHDNTSEKINELVDACKKYLVGHPGVVYFSVGKLARDLIRPVNDQTHDVALHVVFTDRASHDAYQIAPRHLEFVNLQKANWKQVRVFDDDLA